MEGGSRIFVRNERGIAPHDLLPPILRLQKELVADCWLGLVLEDAAHMIEQSEQGKNKSVPLKKKVVFFCIAFYLINVSMGVLMQNSS